MSNTIVMAMSDEALEIAIEEVEAALELLGDGPHVDIGEVVSGDDLTGAENLEKIFHNQLAEYKAEQALRQDAARMMFRNSAERMLEHDKNL